MDIILWLILPAVALAVLLRWLRQWDVGESLVAAGARLWGHSDDEYHRFLHGELLQSGEYELNRVHLQSFSVYAVDHHIAAKQQATCMLTNYRLLVRGARTRLVTVDLADIRSAHPH